MDSLYENLQKVLDWDQFDPTVVQESIDWLKEWQLSFNVEADCLSVLNSVVGDRYKCFVASTLLHCIWYRWGDINDDFKMKIFISVKNSLLCSRNTVFSNILIRCYANMFLMTDFSLVDDIYEFESQMQEEIFVEICNTVKMTFFCKYGLRDYVDENFNMISNSITMFLLRSPINHNWIRMFCGIIGVIDCSSTVLYLLEYFFSDSGFFNPAMLYQVSSMIDIIYKFCNNDCTIIDHMISYIFNLLETNISITSDIFFSLVSSLFKTHNPNVYDSLESINNLLILVFDQNPCFNEFVCEFLSVIASYLKISRQFNILVHMILNYMHNILVSNEFVLDIAQPLSTIFHCFPNEIYSIFVELKTPQVFLMCANIKPSIFKDGKLSIEEFIQFCPDHYFTIFFFLKFSFNVTKYFPMYLSIIQHSFNTIPKESSKLLYKMASSSAKILAEYINDIYPEYFLKVSTLSNHYIIASFCLLSNFLPADTVYNELFSNIEIIIEQGGFFTVISVITNSLILLEKSKTWIKSETAVQVFVNIYCLLIDSSNHEILKVQKGLCKLSKAYFDIGLTCITPVFSKWISYVYENGLFLPQHLAVFNSSSAPHVILIPVLSSDNIHESLNPNNPEKFFQP